MKKNMNTSYIVAINPDGTYPLSREGAMIGDKETSYVQSGSIVAADAVTDGQIIPRVRKSLYYTSTTWADIQDKTWQYVKDRYLW